MKEKGLVVLSLFDGMSCGQIALSNLGIKVDKYFASEVDRDAIVVTNHNFPNTVQIGDVTKVSYKDGVLYTENGSFEVDIDLLIGGSPCQDLSRANENQKGLAGEKSGLFYEYVRILREVDPKYFLLENVKMKKEYENVITDELGVEPININSKNYSAQLRNRYYWTNIDQSKRDVYYFWCSPSPNRWNYKKNKNVKYIAYSHCLQNILTDGYTDREQSRSLLESDSRPLSNPIKMFHRYYSTEFTTLIFKDEGHYKRCVEVYNKYFKGNSAKQIDNVIALLDEINDVEIINEIKNTFDGLRYLNVEEMERLQTVPVGYTSVLNSRNKSASLLGNGWTVSVIQGLFYGLRCI